MATIEYERCLDHFVSKQAPAEEAALHLLNNEVANALALDCHGQTMTAIVRYELRRFGSRRYGVALPSSDLDIVVQLPMDIDRLRVDQKQILERVLERLRFDARVTGREDAK